jgi:hypothetical protein
VLVIQAINNGWAPLPNGRGQIFNKNANLTPFWKIGETLKQTEGCTLEGLDRFAAIWAAERGLPVNIESMPEIDLTKVMRGSNTKYEVRLAQVRSNAIKLMGEYSQEQYAAYKKAIDGCHAYLTPIVETMRARGMIDTGGLSTADWIDRYVSAAPDSGKFSMSSPLKQRDVTGTSHKSVVSFMDGIGNALNHYTRWMYYNEYVKGLSEKYGFASDKGEVGYFDDAGEIRYVDAPEHIVRQLKDIVNPTKASWKFLNENWYKNMMYLSRTSKIATPAFAQLNIVRDATLGLFRYGVHPVALIETIGKLFTGGAQKTTGLVGMGTPQSLGANPVKNLENISHVIAKNKVQRVLQYAVDSVLGVSESLMRNYASQVESNLGRSERDQMYALIGGTTDFTVRGNSTIAANLKQTWQFAGATLNVLQSWNLGFRELYRDLGSDDMQTRSEAVYKSIAVLASLAAGVVFKEREKERKELQDYVTANKLPIRINGKILAIPQSYSTGVMLENAISTVIAGWRDGKSPDAITKELALDVYQGIVGLVGRDGDPQIKTMIATMSPTLIEPIVRSILNVQYGGRTIDPFTYGQSFTHYFNSTSTVAKKIAAGLHEVGIDGVSPIKLDYLFRSFLGRYGTALQQFEANAAGETGGVSAIAKDLFKNQFVAPVPEGIKTQAYADWKKTYARLRDDLDQIKKGNLVATNNMVKDLVLMDRVESRLQDAASPQEVFALSIFGLDVIEAYNQHKALMVVNKIK